MGFACGLLASDLNAFRSKSTRLHHERAKVRQVTKKVDQTCREGGIEVGREGGREGDRETGRQGDREGDREGRREGANAEVLVNIDMGVSHDQERNPCLCERKCCLKRL